MSEIASQITSLTIVYSTVLSGADQSKHQSSASLAFVWEIHRWPVNFPHKWPVTRKIFPFDDVIMVHVDGLLQYCSYSSGLAKELLQFWTKPSNSYICSPYAALLIARGLHIYWYLFIFLYDCACINHENTLCTIFIFSRRNNQYVVHRFPPWAYVEIGQ